MTGKVTVMDHPLIAHKISYIRREDVGTKEFREMIGEIAQLMCYEATRDLKLKDVKIKTPIAEMTGKELAGKKLAIVPILRAGVGMVDGMLSLKLWSRWSITASFRLTAAKGKCLWSILCWRREVPAWLRSVC